MRPVILSGGSDDLGRRVAAQLALVGGGEVIVAGRAASAHDHDHAGHDHAGHDHGAHDLGRPAIGFDDGGLAATFSGAGAVVHLGGAVDETRAVLAAVSGAGVDHVVLLSSATVYGAWSANPVPLTEDTTLRPNPELDFAVRAAERERLAAEWQLEHPGTTLTVLRPATPVAEEADGWLAQGLRAAAAIRSAGDGDPPAQFLHLDDLASAVSIAVAERLDGAYNVAPDGWIAGDDVQALAGRPRVRLPQAVASRLSSARWRLGLAPAPPGLAPYTRHPWVIANDRLKAAGWSPTYSNEEAYVAGTRPAPWATVSPQRRQELALGGMAAALVGVAGGVGVLVRRRVRRR